MRLIYRCLRCAAEREADAPVEFATQFDILNHAYNLTDRDRIVMPFDLHPCGDGVIGVAQLVAVRE